MTAPAGATTSTAGTMACTKPKVQESLLWPMTLPGGHPAGCPTGSNFRVQACLRSPVSFVVCHPSPHLLQLAAACGHGLGCGDGGGGGHHSRGAQHHGLKVGSSS